MRNLLVRIMAWRGWGTVETVILVIGLLIIAGLFFEMSAPSFATPEKIERR